MARRPRWRCSTSWRTNPNPNPNPNPNSNPNPNPNPNQVQHQLAAEASDWITGRYDLHDDARDGVVKDEDDVAEELETPAEVGSDED